MTKHETPRSVRDMPAPYAVCDSCGNTPALADPLGGSEALCPACALRRLRYESAAEHLRRLMLPALGAWGNFWTAAGVPHGELLSLLETESGGDMHPEAGDRFRREVLATARRQSRPEPYRDHVPERVRVNTAELPEVVRVLYPDSPSRRPYFEQVHPLTGKRRQYQTGPGLDLLTLTLPDGSAVLIPLGIRGEIDLSRGEAVRVPAELLPVVLADWRSRQERDAEGEA